MGTVLSSVVSQIPLIRASISYVIITPLMFAAVLSMAYAAVDGTPEYGDLRAGIDAHWRSLAGAYAVLFGAGLVVGFAVVSPLAAVVLAGSTGGALSSPGPGILAVFGLVALVSLLATMVLQFVDVSIVIGGADALEAFPVSWRIVRTEPASVLDYAILRSLATFGPIAAVWVLSSSPSRPSSDGNSRSRSAFRSSDRQ